MYNYAKLLTLAVLLTTLSCQKYTVDRLPPERLHFASGGGFTGQVKEYILILNNGTVLSRDAADEDRLVRLGALDKAELSQIGTMLAGIDFGEASAGNSTGNVTNSLTYYHDDQGDRLNWSSSGPAPTTDAGKLYKQLMAQVTRLRQGA